MIETPESECNTCRNVQWNETHWQGDETFTVWNDEWINFANDTSDMLALRGDCAPKRGDSDENGFCRGASRWIMFI